MGLNKNTNGNREASLPFKSDDLSLQEALFKNSSIPDEAGLKGGQTERRLLSLYEEDT